MLDTCISNSSNRHRNRPSSLPGPTLVLHRPCACPLTKTCPCPHTGRLPCPASPCTHTTRRSQLDRKLCPVPAGSLPRQAGHWLLELDKADTPSHSSFFRAVIMNHFSQPIATSESFSCDDSTCRCKLPSTPKKVRSGAKDDAIKMEWEDVNPGVVQEPLNFSQIEGRLYRSSFPRPGNYEFLDSLNLRTILCLVEDEPLPAQYIDWTHRRGIDLIQIGMPGHKEAFRDGIPYELVGEALRLVVNASRYPMLIHCNRGKHRTGTVVACLRKLKGWHVSRALNEYAVFSHPKERTTDQDFIEAFEVTELRTRVTRHRALAGLIPEAPPSPFTSMLNLAKA